MANNSLRLPRVTPDQIQGVLDKWQGPCEHAEVLLAWVNDLFTHLNQNMSRSALALAQKELQDRYHAMWSQVPEEHRILVTNTSHKCIWHIYKEAYDALHTFEIRYHDNPFKSFDREVPDFISLGNKLAGEHSHDGATETTTDKG